MFPQSAVSDAQSGRRVSPDRHLPPDAQLTGAQASAVLQGEAELYGSRQTGSS